MVLITIVPMFPVLLVKDQLDALFSNTMFVGCALLVTALVLLLSERAPRLHKDAGSAGWLDAFLVGCAQAVAVVPGISRSGSTIATGLLLGNRKEAVARFSFLMVLAPILGEMLLETASGDLTASVGGAQLTAGFAAAFVTGCAACKFMLEIVKRGKLIWFALYCAAAGIVSLFSYFC